MRHAGARITAGERWVLVLFLNSVEMRAAEHGRRFRARAQELFEAKFAVADEVAGGAEGAEEEREEEEEEEEEDGAKTKRAATPSRWAGPYPRSAATA